MDITWEGLRALLSRFKDASVLLGILYFVSFLLLLPFWLANTPNEINTKAALLLAAVTAFLLINILLNWTYYALVVVPAITAIGIFIIGASLWIATPLVMSPIQAIFGLFTGGFGGGFADLVAGKVMGGFGTMISGATETISRIGQFLMIVAGWFWWLNDRLKNIDHKALGFYLLCLAVLGFSTGVTSLQGLVIFLYIWLWITYRLEQKEGLPQLNIVFKIVASLVVLTKTTQYFTMSNAGLGFYGVCLSGGFLALIWKFKWFITGAPEGVRNVANFLIKHTDNTFFIGKKVNNGEFINNKESGIHA